MDVKERAEALAGKMSTQLRVKGDTLADVASNAGRKLPRHLQRAADVVIEAESMAAHPKLAKQVNERQVRKAQRKLDRFLDRQDPRAERWGEIMDGVAKVAFVIFTIALVAFLILLYQGAFD